MRTVIVGILVLCLACGSSSMGAPQKSIPAPESDKNPLRVSPESLGAVILDNNVELMTRDGTYLKGRVSRASAEALTLRVRECHPKDRCPGGEADVRTAEVSVVRIKKGGTPALAIALGVLGAFGAGAAAAFAADDIHSDAGFAAVVWTSAAAGATGGAMLGRQLVKKTVTLNVAPIR